MFVPAEQQLPKYSHEHSSNAECIPDTPPEGSPPALACLTPSAMALLQPGVGQRSPQQHRRVYAPASLFPGFATREKLQPQPAASQHLEGRMSAAGNQRASHQQPQRAPVTAVHQTRSIAPGCMHSGASMHDSQDLSASHSAQALRQLSESRHSRELISCTSGASTRSRGQALSDTACQGHRLLLVHPAVDATGQGGDVSSEQHSVAAQRSQEGRPSSGQPGKQQVPPGSLAQPRAALQPRSGQSGQSGHFQDNGSGQPGATVCACDLFHQGLPVFSVHQSATCSMSNRALSC